MLDYVKGMLQSVLNLRDSILPFAGLILIYALGATQPITLLGFPLLYIGIAYVKGQ